MTGKSGAARIALETGCPVIPVGQWGAQELLAPYATRPRLFPRKHVTMKAGDPVDLADLVAQPRTQAVVNEATDRIMAAVTGLVEEIRGETAPAERFDPRKAGVSEIGNPKVPRQASTERRRARTTTTTTRRSSSDAQARSPSSAPGPGGPRSPWCSPTRATR